jgi:hypothetical protein
LVSGASHKERPVTLTVLCILSFIGSGLAFFTYSMVTFSYQEFMTALQEIQFDLPQVELIRHASKGFFISGMLLQGSSLLGVSLIWRLHKAGFHFYTMSQLLIPFHPWLFLKMDGFPFFSLLISVIFIFLYSLHLKYLS